MCCWGRKYSIFELGASMDFRNSRQHKEHTMGELCYEFSVSYGGVCLSRTYVRDRNDRAGASAEIV